MTTLFRFFVQRHTFALILTGTILLLGALTAPNINRNTFPTVDLEEVVITMRYPGASSEDIEQKITIPIEDAIKSIAGIKRYSSYSVENSSLVDILIDSTISDPAAVKKDIQDAVNKITTFPMDRLDDPTITEIDTEAFPIIELGLTSEQYSFSKLRAIAKELNDALTDISGIKETQSFGFLAKEVHILPSPDRLDQYQISLLQLVSAISNQNKRASMGATMNDQTMLSATIVNDSRFLTLNDLRSAIIRSNFNGQSVRLSDVALVMDNYEDEVIESRIMGVKGMSFNIVKNESADILTVVESIDAIINDFENRYEFLSITKANDFSKYLKNRLNVMISNGAIGLALVLIVLAFFLNLRLAFWVALGIPVSVMGVFLFMPVFDVNINIISLLALIIVIGIIVDDGIIVGENIAKKQEEGLSPVDAAVVGIREVFKPVITTILTTIIAFSPMFFMSGIMGKFVYQIPMVIIFALIISLIEITIALPAHIAYTMPIKPPQKLRGRQRFIHTMRLSYEGILTTCLRFRYLVVIGFTILFFASIYYAKTSMKFVLFPDSSAVQFFVRFEAPAGTSLAETTRRVASIESAILNLPDNELQAMSTRMGMIGDSFFMMEQENVGMIIVDLSPSSERSRSARDIMNEIKEKTEQTPGFTNISYQVESGGPPVGKAINITIISNDDMRRHDAATEMMAFINRIDGVISLERSDRIQKQQLTIQLDYDAISRYGLSVPTIQETIRTGFSGAIASSVRRGDETVNFIVKFSDAHANKTSTLESLRIPNNQNRLIQLSDVATLSFSQGAPNYYHYNGIRATTISGDIDESTITSTDITARASAAFSSDKYPSVSFVYGGKSEETMESIQDLIRAFIAALVGIAFLLILLFNSLLQPVLVILTVPFGIIGVIIAFALHGQDLGFISIVGTIGLIGVVVNDSLVLVNHINTRIQTKKQSLIPTVIQASGDRFRPILITSFSTVAGLLPLAYGIGGSDPFIAPMALAIGYGLIFSTPLTLYLLPSLYVISEDIKGLISKKTI